MSWRSLVISSKVQLSIEKDQLCISSYDSIKIPVEDISVIVLESLQSMITTYTLSKLAERNVLVFICDEKHLPQGVFLPFIQHSRITKIISAQWSMSKPTKNRVWQKIIERKIWNQGRVLEIIGFDEAKTLMLYSNKVQSGDKSRREGIAAREYFRVLFPDMSRREDTLQNAGLNYGYAILRGAISRSLVSYGLLPTIGVGHYSELNAFNLADDIIEVFRPLVDLFVYTHLYGSKDEELSKELRGHLVNLLNYQIEMESMKISVLNAIDRVVETYQKVCLTGNYTDLILPKIIELQVHDYE